MSHPSCPKAAVDIVFLVDGNLGIQDPDMMMTKSFVKRIADSFEVFCPFIAILLLKCDLTHIRSVFSIENLCLNSFVAAKNRSHIF